jgi:hypothetical protein
MYKFIYLLLFFVGMISCVDTNQPTVEINFASIVGKYTGTEKSCATNTGDTLCSGSIPAQYNVILRSASNIQINPISGNIVGGLYVFESSGSPNNEHFVFKNATGSVKYTKSISKLEIYNGGSTMSNFLIFEGIK